MRKAIKRAVVGMEIGFFSLHASRITLHEFVAIVSLGD
jgi:hypothetical protein